MQLKKIVENGNDTISLYAVSNNNCPSEALKMILERGNDDLISRITVQNPNCTPETLLQEFFVQGEQI